MMHGNVISNQNSFTVASKTSSADVPLDKFEKNNRYLVRLYSYCTAIGTVLGALITMYVLQDEYSGATLYSAAFCYSSLGAISGILFAGFYDVIARLSLDTWVGDE